MKKTTFLYLLLAAAALFWLYGRFFGSEEARIRTRLDEVRSLVGKSSSESALDSVSRARSFAELFTDSFSAQIKPFGQRVEDLPELMRLFVALRHASEKISLDYRDIEIVVGESGREAIVQCAALLNGGPGGLLADQAYRLELRLRKVGGEWKIAEAIIEEGER